HFPRLFSPKISDGGKEDPYLSDSAVGDWSTATEWVYTIDMQGLLAKFKGEGGYERGALRFWVDKKDHGLEDIRDRFQRFSEEKIEEMEKFLEDFDLSFLNSHAYYNEARSGNFQVVPFSTLYLTIVSWTGKGKGKEHSIAPSSTTTSSKPPEQLDAEVDRILRDKNFTCKLELYQLRSGDLRRLNSIRHAISRSRLRPSTNLCVTRLKLRSDSINCLLLLFQEQNASEIARFPYQVVIPASTKKKLLSYTSVELYTKCISVFAVPIPIANLNSGLKSDIIPRSSLPSTKAYQQHLQPEVGEGQRLGVPPPLVRLERRTITVTRIKATMTPGIPPEPCHEVPLKDGERLKERLKAYFETVWKFQKDSVDIKFDTNIDYVLGDVEADFAFGYRWSNRSGSTTGFVASSRHPFLAPSQSPPLDGSFIEVFSGTSSVNEDGYVTHA
ncbi:hypothetical protein F5050DRAFT_1710513, partial [Lentinula boryana]